jgi:DNA replication protein DnaC
VPNSDSFKKINDDILEAARKKHAFLLYDSALVPARHKRIKNVDITHPEWLNAAERMKKFIGTGCIIVLCGSRGVGKTQLGVQAIREACLRGMDALYTKAMDIFINLRESYRSDIVSESKLIKSFIKYKMLVIDALEEKSDSEWENRILSLIIDKRYDEMVDTILISNEQPNVFMLNHGSSISSRINETGGIIECNWNSFRTSESP